MTGDGRGLWRHFLNPCGQACQAHLSLWEQQTGILETSTAENPEQMVSRIRGRCVRFASPGPFVPASLPSVALRGGGQKEQVCGPGTVDRVLPTLGLWCGACVPPPTQPCPRVMSGPRRGPPGAAPTAPCVAAHTRPLSFAHRAQSHTSPALARHGVECSCAPPRASHPWSWGESPRPTPESSPSTQAPVHAKV